MNVTSRQSALTSTLLPSPSGIAIEIPFALGELVLGLEAYLVRDWRELQMLAYAPLLLLLLLWFVVDESPR